MYQRSRATRASLSQSRELVCDFTFQSRGEKKIPGQAPRGGGARAFRYHAIRRLIRSEMNVKDVIEAGDQSGWSTPIVGGETRAHAVLLLRRVCRTRCDKQTTIPRQQYILIHLRACSRAPTWPPARNASSEAARRRCRQPTYPTARAGCSRRITLHFRLAWQPLLSTASVDTSSLARVSRQSARSHVRALSNGSRMGHALDSFVSRRTSRATYPPAAADDR